MGLAIDVRFLAVTESSPIDSRVLTLDSGSAAICQPNLEYDLDGIPCQLANSGQQSHPFAGATSDSSEPGVVLPWG